MVPTSLLQRDGRAFEQPDSYRPGRELNEPTPHYFPFGGGERRCVGEPLARAELAAVPAAIGEAVTLFPLSREPEPVVQRATVLVPKRGLLVRGAAS
jgi:cytochrome P450